MKKYALPIVLLLIITYLSCGSENNAPIISSVTANPLSIYPGETSTVSVNATDEDGDALTYAWACSYGTFSSTSLETVTWTAPSNTGDFEIRVVVQDEGDLADTAYVTITVNPTWIEGTNNNSAPIYDFTYTYSGSTVSGVPAGYTVDTVWVTASITHSYYPDLTIWLESPTGTQILFWHTDFPSSGTDIRYTTSFAGETINGTWTLIVYDGAWGDEGTLDWWSLKINW